MRVGIQSWGSMGDVRPMLCLGHALVRAGHQVVFAATCVDAVDHAETCRRLGLEHLPAPSLVTVELSQLRQGLLAGHALSQLSTLYDQLLLPSVPMMREVSQALCQRCDVVVGHFLVHPLRAAAERADRPHLSVAFWPGMVPGAQQPPWPLPDLGAWSNRLCWALVRRMINRTLLPRVAEDWTRLGLPRPRDVLRDCWYAPRGNLLACSPQLYPQTAAWPEQHLCGAFHVLPDDSQTLLPPVVEAFLAEGPPPVLLTLGSPQLLDPQGAMALLIALARRLGCRALINTTSPAHPAWTREERICFTGGLNHRLIMPRCAAILHHGGAGTSHAAARAGRPSLVVAFIDEQLAWGWTLHRRQVAARPLRYRHATVERLVGRMRRCLQDPMMRQHAQELGARMAQEDGSARAVDIIAGACSEMHAHAWPQDL